MILHLCGRTAYHEPSGETVVGEATGGPVEKLVVAVTVGAAEVEVSRLPDESLYQLAIGSPMHSPIVTIL
jgi:hypothetical protein